MEFDEPIPPFETRFHNRLEGILASVKQTFNQSYLNKRVIDAASAYFNQLIRGHPFANGNKRMGVLYSHYFLLKNGVELTLTPYELYHFAIIIAKAGDIGVDGETTKEWCKEIFRDFTKDLTTQP